jgi:tetratricopeptide (TPR) repeat protein
LSARAARSFLGDSAAERIERIFHLLVADAQAGAAALRELYEIWDDSGRHENLQALGLPFKEIFGSISLDDPARAQAALSYGLINRDRLPQRELETLARQAVELFDILDDPKGRIDARDFLGDILEAQGKLGEGLAEYQACKDICLALTQIDPDNSGWRRDLSVAHNNIGGVLVAQGELGDALAEFEASLSITERLAALDPTNAVWKEDLENTREWILHLQSKRPRRD